MKTKLFMAVAVAAAMLCTMANQNAYAAGQEPVKSEEKIEKGDTFKIISDTKENGVRHIVAVPSKKVCSAKIEFDVKKNRIYNLVYTRGCNGNLKAIGVLVEGMKVKDAIAKFQGLECGKRGTSCTDQLAQVLLAL